jgi:hypothetical protein
MKYIKLLVICLCLSSTLRATIGARFAEDNVTWYTGSNLVFSDSYAVSQIVVTGDVGVGTTTLSDHRLLVGDSIVIKGVTGDTDLNNTTPVKITAVTSTTFTFPVSSVTAGTYNNAGIYAVPMGKFSWDLEHDPSITDSVSSSSMTGKWDFEGGTCDTGTDLFSFVGLMLPDGTEVKLGLASGGVLPPELVKFWPDTGNRRTSYFIRDSTPATTMRTTSGTFKLAATYGGTAINLSGANCSGVKLTFEGYRHAITMHVGGALPFKCDATTNLCWKYTPGTPDTPIAHGYTSSSSVKVFSAGAGSSLPAPLVTWYGSTEMKYCIVPNDSTTFYLRGHFSGGACPTTFQTSPFSAQWTCRGRNDPNTNLDAACQLTDGSTLETYIRFRFTSVVSGTLPGDLSLATDYWTTANSGSTTVGGFEVYLFSLHPAESRLAWGDNETLVLNVEVPVEDLTTAGTGTYYVSGSVGNIYVEGIANYPQGTTFSFRSGQDLCCRTIGVTTSTNPNRYGAIDTSSNMGTYIAKIPAKSAPATYSIDVTLDANSNGAVGCTDCATFPIPVIVKTLVPVDRADPTPASYTAIPQLARWEANMTSELSGGGGSTFSGRVNKHGCPPPRTTYADVVTKFSESGQSFGSMTDFNELWFYDGAATMYGIKERTGQTAFANCGDYVANFFASTWSANPSAGNSYALFPHGMMLAYGRWKGGLSPDGSSPDRFRNAIQRLASGGQDLYGNNTNFAERETSYALATKLRVYELLKQSSPDLPIFIDAIIGFIHNISTDNETGNFHEPFMAGLMQRELTTYYRVYHKDPRIPYVLKLLSDKTYTSWYNTTTNKLLYNPYPYGRKCYNTCGVETPIGGQILNAMMTGTEAFLWRYTGDNTYRDRFDEYFSTMHEGDADLRYGAPKDMNQGHYVALKAVKWREGTESPF